MAPVVGRKIGAPDLECPWTRAYSSMTSERPRPGMRKNGAGAVPSASAAVTDAMPSSISFWARSIGSRCMFDGMVLGVGGNGVAGIAHLAHAFRIGVGLASDQEEGRLHALGGEDVQDLVAVFRQRTVVEGQHHLMICQRQRLGILHGADDGMFARIDHQRARRADARRDDPDNRRPTRSARRRRPAWPGRKRPQGRPPEPHKNASDHRTPASFQTSNRSIRTTDQNLRCELVF